MMSYMSDMKSRRVVNWMPGVVASITPVDLLLEDLTWLDPEDVSYPLLHQNRRQWKLLLTGCTAVWGRQMAALKFSRTRTMIEPEIIFVFPLLIVANTTVFYHYNFARVVSCISFFISSVNSHDCLTHQPQFPASVKTWTVRAQLLLTSMYHSSVLV